jgi:hypothetical protein
VKRCPRNTVADQDAQTQQKKVPFFCLDRSSSEARRLLRQVREGKNVNSEGQQKTFVEEIEQPTRCQAAF